MSPLRLLSNLKSKLIQVGINSKLKPDIATSVTVETPIQTEQLGLPMLNTSTSRDTELSGWFNSKTKELKTGFQIQSDDTVLDVGCGDAPFTRFCAKMGAQLFYTDIRFDVVHSTRDALSNNPDYRHAGFVSDGCRIPIKDRCFDKIIIMEVLEHLRAPNIYLKEFFRIGKPGALYLITVPDASQEAVQQDLAPDIYFQEPNHIQIYSQDEFQLLITESGLEIKVIDHYGFFWSVWWSMFWACDQDLGEPWHPVLSKWADTWNSLLDLEQGPKVKRALDKALPKSVAIIAQKPL